jgi:BirA family biotin operon repressor/biotin-[acetyl-CoA-carboxylase] ligase
MDSNLIKEINFDIIDSTQTFAKNYIDTNQLTQWTVVRSNIQTQGKGQEDRKWVSPMGSLNCTFIIPFETTEGLKILPYASILASVATCHVLELYNLKPEIKWVNDVRINNKKVSGCLVESSIQGNSIILIIGIGINVNISKDDLNAIDQAATSISQELDKKLELDEVFQSLKTELYNIITTAISQGKEDYIKYYDDHLTLKEKDVKIVSKEKETKGVFKGIDENGFAKLFVNGKIETICDGRMSEE